MKKLCIIAAITLAAAVCVADQKSIVSVPQPADGKMGTLRAAINTQLANSQANFVELYATTSALTSSLSTKASSSCFANASAMSACFPSLSIGGDDLGSATSSSVVALFPGTGGCLGANGQKVDCGNATGGITHANSDGSYYASRNGVWANLTGVFAPPLGSDDNYVTDAEKTAWNAKQDSLVSGTNIKSINGTTLLGSGDLTISGSMPSWMPSVAPTNGRQILQATGGCSLSAYDNQGDCETNSGTWTTPTYQNTSIISGLINDTGTANDDLWSAAKITGELAGKQASLGFIPENAASKGVANGYAGLGSDGKVPTAQLPTLGTTYALPSLADAQAGISTTPYVWSPQRVAQAIAALAPSGGTGSAATSIQMTFVSDAALTTQTGSKTKIPSGMKFTTADVGCNASDSITFTLQKSTTVNGTYTAVGTVSIAGTVQSEGVDISSWAALASGAWVRIDITSSGSSATECTIAIGGTEQ